MSGSTYARTGSRTRSSTATMLFLKQPAMPETASWLYQMPSVPSHGGIGHLWGDNSCRWYYFLFWDYLHAYPHAINISEYDLTQHIRAIPGKKVLVLDTCYAGNLSSSPLALSRGIAGDRAV